MKNLNLGIEERSLAGVVVILNKLLADEFLLYVKTRNFHWNVTGPHFHDLHKLFETQYEELNTIVDDVAERARSMGGVASGSMAEFLKLTRLKEQAGQLLADQKMIKSLLDDHETIIRTLRDDLETCANKYNDAGTADFLTGIMEQHEKTAWMLRATVKG